VLVQYVLYLSYLDQSHGTSQICHSRVCAFTLASEGEKNMVYAWGSVALWPSVAYVDAKISLYRPADGESCRAPWLHCSLYRGLLEMRENPFSLMSRAI